MPEAVRDHNYAVVVSTAMQLIEGVDRVFADRAASRDIRRRIAEVTRGVPEIRLKKGRICH